VATKRISKANGGGVVSHKVATVDDFFKPNTNPVALSTISRMVHIRQLAANDVMEFTDLPKDATTKERRLALMRLIARAVADENGKSLFSEDDLGRLGEIPVVVFNELSEAVLDAAGIVTTSPTADTGVGGAEGNASGGAPNSASSTV
jgi:hypothetical protein